MTSSTRRSLVLALASWAILSGGIGALAADRLVVGGVETDLGETVVIAELKTGQEPGTYRLRSGADATDSGHAQIFRQSGKLFLAVVLESLAKGREVTFDLVREPDRAGMTLVEVTGTANLRILREGHLVAEYRTEGEPKPYLFPVVGPTDVSFTRAYPMQSVAGEDRDHPHQRSFWFTHGKVNGIDFWSEEKGHGTIRETAKLARVSGPVVAVLDTTNAWIGPGGQKVCEDERVYRFFNTKQARLIDLDVTIKASAGPLTFGDTKEGMFGVRVASSMDVKRKRGGKITNAEGITDDAAWGKPSPWVDYTGPVSGQAVGVAILNHPASFRYPTTWHVRDYGLFAANPFGWHDFGLGKSGDFTVPAGGTVSFRYRVILHKGDTASAGLPVAFKAYASPPAIRLE